MYKYMDLLGHKVVDLVTGFEGIVESVSFDLYGCIQIDVRPKTKKGEIVNGRWFDAKRLKKISDKPIMPVPNFEKIEETGGADLPLR